MIHCIKNNIKSLFKNQKILAVLLIVVQIFSVVVVMFSYGVSNHYEVKTDEVEGTDLVYEITRKNSEELEELGIEVKSAMSYEDIDKFLKKILPYIENKLDYFFVMSVTGEYLLLSSNGYRDGKYTVSSQLKNKIIVGDGEKFTDEDMNSGDEIILAPENIVDEDGYVTMYDRKYYVKGILGEFTIECYIPFASMPKESSFKHVSFVLSKPLLESEYKYIIEWAKNCFNEDTINLPVFNGIVNESQNRVYRDIMVVTMLLIVVCSINYCIIYRYILEKRRRTFAVSRICGCSRYKAVVIYMVELLGVSFITLLIGLLIYSKLVLPEAVSNFEYIELFYNTEVYKKIATLYMGILFATYTVLVVRFVGKTPVSLIKEE